MGPDSRAASAELLRLAPRVLELGAGVGVDQLTGLNPLEAVPFEEPGVRCFQQRPGYSASPEVDVAAAFLADWALDRHVGDLEASARREYAIELCEDRILVRDEINHAV